MIISSIRVQLVEGEILIQDNWSTGANRGETHEHSLELDKGKFGGIVTVKESWKNRHAAADDAGA